MISLSNIDSFQAEMPAPPGVPKLSMVASNSVIGPSLMNRFREMTLMFVAYYDSMIFFKYVKKADISHASSISIFYSFNFSNFFKIYSMAVISRTSSISLSAR